MNILFFLSPKQDLMYVYDDFTLRQTLEKWENNRYASIPVLNRQGKYVGTLKEPGFYHVNPFCIAVNPAAHTKLNQSGDVDGGMNKKLLQASGVSATTASSERPEMQFASVEALRGQAGFALIDGDHLPPMMPVAAETLVKGDAKSASVAAASILAKVSRDRMMREADALYPGYGFAKHKGYGTAAHVAAIRALGPCPIHRPSFLKKILSDREPD